MRSNRRARGDTTACQKTPSECETRSDQQGVIAAKKRFDGARCSRRVRAPLPRLRVDRHGGRCRRDRRGNVGTERPRARRPGPGTVARNRGRRFQDDDDSLVRGVNRKRFVVLVTIVRTRIAAHRPEAAGRANRVRMPRVLIMRVQQPSLSAARCSHHEQGEQGCPNSTDHLPSLPQGLAVARRSVH